MTKVAGVILAGGQARRMGGGDKCRLKLDGISLLDRVFARVEPQVEQVAINANGDPMRFADVPLPVVSDSEPDFPGPLAGVLAGLDWAASVGADQIVTVAADTPFFPHDLVERLTAEGNGIVLAATKTSEKGVVRHPTFGLWPAALKEDLRAALRGGVRKIVAWTDSHDAGTVEFPTLPIDPFFNINTPDDLALAEALVLKGAA